MAVSLSARARTSPHAAAGTESIRSEGRTASRSLRSRERWIAVTRRDRAAVRLEVDPRQLRKDRRHAPHLERRIVGVVHDEIELSLERRGDWHNEAMKL